MYHIMKDFLNHINYNYIIILIIINSLFNINLLEHFLHMFRKYI